MRTATKPATLKRTLATATKTKVATKSRSHEEAMTEALRNDPEFASEYLKLALEEADSEGGREALLLALRRVAEAQGMADVAARAGVPRESLYRVLRPSGNPTIKTLLAVLGAAGLQLSVAPS